MEGVRITRFMDFDGGLEENAVRVFEPVAEWAGRTENSPLHVNLSSFHRTLMSRHTSNRGPMRSLHSFARIFGTIALLISGCAASREAIPGEVRVVFFGDSITEMGVAPGGYVTLIKDSLQHRGSRANIIGAGVSGNKVEQLLARIDKDVIALKPTTVVVYIGINDVWHWTIGMPGAKGSTKEEFETGLRQVLARIQATGARVVLCTPSVIGEKATGTNPEDAMLDEYSDISRRLARESGSALCDLRKAFVEYISKNNPENREKGILTTDRVHLNDAGNHLVADEILRALDRAATLDVH
jgi:isoamyl acetate esterase